MQYVQLDSNKQPLHLYSVWGEEGGGIVSTIVNTISTICNIVNSIVNTIVDTRPPSFGLYLKAAKTQC